MNKEELLQELSQKVSSGEVSREEITSRLNLGLPEVKEKKESSGWSPHFSVTKILYILGVAVVIIGIVIFFAQIWGDIGSFGRIAVTLGLGVVFAAIGSVLLKSKPDNIGAVFHFVGGIFIPGGAWIMITELAGTAFPTHGTIALTYGILFVFYLLLTFAHKNFILTFFAIMNGTAFVYLLTQFLTSGLYVRDLYAYLTIAVGISYLLLAYSFRNGWNKNLVQLLYFFGTLSFLGASFSQVFDSIVWSSVFILLVIGGFFLSVKLKSRGILVLSTFFLVAYLLYITGKYFADSLGWPISLIIFGLIIIGLAYVSISINKKYIKK